MAHQAVRTRRGQRALIGAGALAAAALVVAGCGSSSSSPTTSSAASAVTITSGQVAGLGTVLVNGQGLTLYTFVPDNRATVTCVGTCAAVWPPVALASGQTAAAAGGVKASLLGSDPNPSGGSVVTYDKWPLYTFTSDTAAGSATGQAVNLNGGLWYVIAPSGVVITKQG